MINGEHLAGEAYRRDPLCIIEKQRAQSRSFLMKVGQPGRMESPLVEQLWSQMQTKHLATLEEMLCARGVVVEAQESKKVCLDVLRKFWLQHCAVIHLQGTERRPATTSCTCFHFRPRAHCPHVYFVRQQLQLETWLAPVLPHHEDAPRDWDSDGSSVRVRPARPFGSP